MAYLERGGRPVPPFGNAAAPPEPLRSGKSSIQKVVFHKMSPNETLFLEATSRVTKDDISHSSFMQFQVWDFPGQLSFLDEAFDCDAIFGNCGALVFVIDSQVGRARPATPVPPRSRPLTIPLCRTTSSRRWPSST